MPLYEYNCRRSGRRVEALRTFEDRKECPCGCGASRLISAPAKTALKWGDTAWEGRYDRGWGRLAGVGRSETNLWPNAGFASANQAR